MAYAREDEQEKFIIVMNNKDKAQSIKFAIEDDQFEDMRSTETYWVKNGSLNLELLPYECLILRAIR
ncbi:hypothetical protein D3C76_1313080 [compost metagenome]